MKQLYVMPAQRALLLTRGSHCSCWKPPHALWAGGCTFLGCVSTTAPQHLRVAGCDWGPVSHTPAGGLSAVHVPGAQDSGGITFPCNALRCVIYTCEAAVGR